VKKKKSTRKSGKGKRRPSKKQLEALAKGQAALGNKAAADKLRKRAAGMSGGGGASKKRKAKGGRKAKKRTANPAAAAAPKKARKARKTSRKTTTTRTTTTRTANPSGRRKIGLTLSKGKGKKKMRATVGELQRATKGSGARYLDIRTGQLKKASEVGRSSNPSVGTGGLVAYGAGVAVGVPTAEIMFRWLATRPGAYGDTKRESGWDGQQAMLRIQRGSGTCAAFVGGAGVVVGGVGWAVLGMSPVAGCFLLGLGTAHVGVALMHGTLALIGGTAKKDEASWGNRVAPELTDWQIEAYDAAIKAANEAATAGDGSGSADKNDGEDTGGGGAVEGLRERVRQARLNNQRRLAARNPQIEEQRRQALAGLQNDPPAVGACCGGCASGRACESSCSEHNVPGGIRDRQPGDNGRAGNGGGNDNGRAGNGNGNGTPLLNPPRESITPPPAERPLAPVFRLPPPRVSPGIMSPWGNVAPMPRIY
jgi:hypothetical protein